MKKKIIKVGEVRGSRLYLYEGQEAPRHTVHKMIARRLVFLSAYQDKYRVPDRVEVSA